MAYNSQKTREWGLETPNSGLFLNDEFNRIYENFKAISPIGSIIAWLPGYFTDGDNGGFTGVSISLADFWRECNGDECNDAESPIFNGSSRFLPKLTDDRFLMGDFVIGVTGGVNLNTLTENHIPRHNHSINHGHSSGSSSGGIHQHLNGVADAGVDCFVYGGTSYGIPGNAVDQIQNDGTPANQGFTSIEWGGSHTHGCNVANHTGSSGYYGNATPTSIDNRPQYLSCKYIIRIK